MKTSKYRAIVDVSFPYDEFESYDLAFLTPKFPPALQVAIEYEGPTGRDLLDSDKHELNCILDHRENGGFLLI